jgi:large subunit ribosomal protein L31
MPRNIHPTWYPEAKVICNGKVVATVGSTKPELQVDLWSGNHPFYTGTQKIIDTEGRVERFMRKYGMSSADVPQMQEVSGEAEDAPAEVSTKVALVNNQIAGKGKKKK